MKDGLNQKKFLEKNKLSYYNNIKVNFNDGASYVPDIHYVH